MDSLEGLTSKPAADLDREEQLPLQEHGDTAEEVQSAHLEDGVGGDAPLVDDCNVRLQTVAGNAREARPAALVEGLQVVFRMNQRHRHTAVTQGSCCSQESMR